MKCWIPIAVLTVGLTICAVFWGVTSATLCDVRTERDSLAAELANMRTWLQDMQNELTETQSELQGTQTDLANTQGELEATQTELANIQADLEVAQAEIDYWRADAAYWEDMYYSMVDTLSVHFIDVGQADSILVDLGETEVLIDGGRYGQCADYIVDYVDGPLEVMVATHPDPDHIGGLIAVLDTFEVNEIWLNGDTLATLTYDQFMAAVDSEGAEVHEARRGDQIEAGGLTFIVLNPVGLSGSINNNSIVLSLSYGEVDFLFTGDAEEEAEESMLTAGIVPNVEILKVGHHGSKTSSSQAFLDIVQPEVATIMVGEGNPYGLPHWWIVTRLAGTGAEIYRTDVNGTILVTTNGVTYTVETEK